MSILTPVPRSLPWYMKLFFALPVVGWMARDVAFGGPENLVYALVILATLWILAIGTWGLVALYLPMVALVPLIFVLMVVFTWG